MFKSITMFVFEQESMTTESRRICKKCTHKAICFLHLEYNFLSFNQTRVCIIYRNEILNLDPIFVGVFHNQFECTPFY